MRKLAFWTSTGILVFVLLSGGIGELLHMWGTLDTATVLGYPPYVLTIIGTWKILGTLVLLLPGVPRLKEWVYAGIVFNMTGAAASHVFADDYGPFAFHVVVTLGLAGLGLATRALQPHGTSSIPLAARLPRRGRRVPATTQALASDDRGHVTLRRPTVTSA